MPTEPETTEANPMTAEELLEIAGKTTPGEWEKFGLSVEINTTVSGPYPVMAEITVIAEGFVHKLRGMTPGQAHDNIAAICAAHNDAPRIIRALLAENAELRSRLTPRPIEEAPKDGTAILGIQYYAAETVELCGITAWDDDFAQWNFNATDQMHEDTGMCSYSWEPTHFLPLPPHPEDVIE